MKSINHFIDDFKDRCLQIKDIEKSPLPDFSIIPLIQIQNVADYYYSVMEKDCLSEKDLPNIMPPWKYFFIEYTLPSTIFYNGVKQQKDSAGRFHFCGVFFSHETDECVYLKSFSAIYSMDYAKIAMCHTKNEIDKYGKLTNSRGGLPTTEVSYMPVLPNERYEAACQLMNNAIQPVLLSLCFCHCKNTIIRKNQMPEKLIKRRNEKGKFTVNKFYTLEIKPIKKILESTRNEKSVTLGTALHICRGHFKNYENSGLFGKYKGLYWWDMQYRGAKEYGEVKKNYAVTT